MYSNNITTNTNSGIIITDVADHFGIFHIIECKTSQQKEPLKEIRIHSEKNIEYFRQLLEQTDFRSITNITCPDNAYKYFLKLYRDAYDKAFPIVKRKINKRYIRKEPWITSGLITSSQTKAKLLKKKLKQPTHNNITNYKMFRDQFNKIKRKMKIDYFHNILETNKHNMKKTWQTLKNVIGKMNDKTNFPQSFLINNKHVYNKTEIAQGFNSFFANIGKTTSQNVPHANKHFSEFLKNRVPNSMFLEPVEEPQIIEIVNKLKPKMSHGYDDIPTRIVKESILKIITPITHIVNRSLMTGRVPTDMKIAKVIPIYKASDPTLFQNYRPVSLLPAFSKILEKVMFNKIMSFLNSNNILYKHQYGFRSKHSTIHPLIHLLNTCAEAENTVPKEITLTVLCDLSKAFDVINHDILAHKLDFYGIRGIVREWIINYLTDRTQYVQFEMNKSECCKIECGVPQGSILGPLLYLIYVNDIANSTQANILSFADDTSLFLSHSNINSLYQIANIEINNLFNWFCANRLSLNAKKTKYIITRSPHNKCDFSDQNLYINNVALTRVGNNCDEESTKFLGVYIDEFLTWKHHVKHVNNKISRSLFMIKKVKNILPQNCLLTLYFSMVHPYITYGLPIWGNATQSVLKKTSLLQKRAIRYIHNSHYNSHTEPLFKISNIMKINDQFDYESLMFMYDFDNGKLPRSFDNVFRYNRDNQVAHQTRQSNLMHIARCNSNFSNRLPLYYLPRIWNAWSKKINSNITRSSYKKNVKSNFLQSYTVSVKCKNQRCPDCAI